MSNNKTEITEQDRKKVLNAYTDACNNILRLFCEKHEYGYGHPDTYWLDEYCSCAMIGDYSVDLQTMIDDLKMDAPEEEFIQWYDYTLELGMIDPSITTPNFKSWVEGCPRYSEKWMEKLRQRARRVQEAEERVREAQKDLDELIRESKNLKY